MYLYRACYIVIEKYSNHNMEENTHNISQHKKLLFKNSS